MLIFKKKCKLLQILDAKSHSLSTCNHWKFSSKIGTRRLCLSLVPKGDISKAYSHYIQPVPNIKMWSKTNGFHIDPPELRKMLGRPKKNRRKDKDEPEKKKYGKLLKKGGKVFCNNSGHENHNKAGCPYKVIFNLMPCCRSVIGLEFVTNILTYSFNKFDIMSTRLWHKS